jgi:mannose-6-phosphate isomerase-like protein (cupin superfamily)
MKIDSLGKMVKGWFVGDFSPAIYSSKEVEVAIKTYKRGEKESRHYHKIATEITAIVSGRVLMNGQVIESGSIVTLSPNESTDFEALEEETITVVVKLPSAPNDKYLC